MAIIYTYPTKATPVDTDLILISDSADSNKTKQVTVASIKGQTAGVTSVAATLPLVASAATGDTTLSLSGLSALGAAGQVIKVNSGATALEFGTVGGGTFSVKDSGGTAITGIDTLDFNTNLSVSHSPGSSTVTINASSGSSVDTFTNAFGTYITGTANSTATGAVNMGTLNLSASDGSSATTATRFLSKDNEWAVPSYTAASVVTSYTNAGNNRILTSSGTGVINGESSLLYSGSILTLGTSSVFNASRSSVTSGVATAPIYVTNSTTGSGGPTNFASNIAGGNGSRHIEFYHQGTAVGSITSTTTNIVINGESSDQRKKKNIVDWTENVLDKFALIEPKKFNFTHQNDSDPLRKGFIAQQMVDKFPEAYNHDYSISDTEGYYSFNAMGMSVYLMKAVKELKAEIDSLKSRISTLEG